MVTLKGTIKSNTVDKYLAPIREQITELVPDGKSVIEYGCGSGNQLLRLSKKISKGVGIDVDQGLIKFATQSAANLAVSNINFIHQDLKESLNTPAFFDVSMTSLVLHVLPPQLADRLVQHMTSSSELVLICAFCKPTSRKDALLLWLDQRFSGHFRQFQDYMQKGYAEGIFNRNNVEVSRCIDTFDPVIKIYVLRGK